MMKLSVIVVSLAIAFSGPIWSQDRQSPEAPLPPAGQALNSMVVPAPPAPEHPSRPLRESLRQPWSSQPASDAAPYRLSDDERRKMRELLRNRAHEEPLK